MTALCAMFSMREAAANLDFETAARMRDEIKRLQATELVLADDPLARHRVGFKPAGGVRTVADAAAYIALQARLLEPDSVKPKRFRIGASGLLNDIEAVLSGTAPAATTTGY